MSLNTISAQPFTAPLSGIATLHVAAGDQVQAGQVLAVIETMKLEAPIIAKKNSRIVRVLIENFTTVSAGDLVFTVEEDA